VRIVVVGASSGLGRCIGIGLAQRGEQVALLARRHDRLVDAAKEAGPGTLAIPCDVTVASSCQGAVEEAASGLGGIDALVYTTGVGPLARLTAAALAHLTVSGGVAAYLSSVSASLTPPWPGLGAYVVSKAALDKLIEAWRAEHPSVGFTRVVVGDCAGGEGPSQTEFANTWDPELAMELGPLWMARNYMNGSLLDVDEVVRVVDHVLRCGATASIPSVTVTPRPPA